MADKKEKSSPGEEFEMTTRTGVQPKAPDAGTLVPTLVVVAGSSSVGRIFRIEGDQPLVIGRSPTVQISIGDDGVSRVHAQVQRNGDEIHLVDLGSRNGTHLNGNRITATTSLKDGDKIQVGSTTMMKFSYRDSLDEALQRNLYESATRDPLTIVHNKKYFAEALEKEFTFASRHPESSLSLMMIDIDHFKQVNDRFGHLAGDAVLKQVATCINGLIRAEDTFARWGGEEFAMLLRNCPAAHVIEVAERVRKTVAALTLKGVPAELKITISIGVASFVPGRFSEATGLVRLADEQLYRAKNGGRNRVEAPPAGL